MKNESDRGILREDIYDDKASVFGLLDGSYEEARGKSK